MCLLYIREGCLVKHLPSINKNHCLTKTSFISLSISQTSYIVHALISCTHVLPWVVSILPQVSHLTIYSQPHFHVALLHWNLHYICTGNQIYSKRVIYNSHGKFQDAMAPGPYQLPSITPTASRLVKKIMKRTLNFFSLLLVGPCRVPVNPCQSVNIKFLTNFCMDPLLKPESSSQFHISCFIKFVVSDYK
jgi:hypothetical protein